jgi:hypothetical protein
MLVEGKGTIEHLARATGTSALSWATF